MNLPSTSPAEQDAKNAAVNAALKDLTKAGIDFAVARGGVTYEALNPAWLRGLSGRS